MRAPIRHERFRRRYVSLGGIEELTRIDPGDPTVVGALATHTAIAALEAGNGPLGSLIEAARTSAFLAIRDTATLAGNICTVFPEADLVPPLLASEAQVDVASPAGRESLELAEYLVSRGARPAGEVVVSVTVPAPAGRRSAYERLTVRGSGEFPVASPCRSTSRWDVAGGPRRCGQRRGDTLSLGGAEAALVEGRWMCERPSRRDSPRPASFCP
jgi:carbon-monoxide dehydrogenase medium subunit